MPDILLTRIDNRLVHGQVGVAWTSSLAGCNLIVVADDLAAEDEIQQQFLRMHENIITDMEWDCAQPIADQPVVSFFFERGKIKYPE